MIPFIAFFITGIVASVLDNIILQKLVFQVFGVVGLVIFVLGGYIRNKARFELKKKAGFDSLVSTMKLDIVYGQ